MSKTHFSEFFPVNDPQSLRQTKYLNEEDRLKWVNFLNITRSEFIQEKLLKVQGGLCPLCSKSLFKTINVIHHVDYDQLCTSGNAYRVRRPTEKNPDRVLKVPKCNSCLSYVDCIKKLILVHSKCHYILHLKEGRIKKPSKTKSRKEGKDQISVPSKNSSKELLELVNVFLDLINLYSDNSVFFLRYNTRHISLRPKNFIYFVPKNTELTVSISLGELEKWDKILKKENIRSRLKFKQEKLHRLYFDIDVQIYKNNMQLINTIVRDAVKTYYLQKG